MHGCMEGTARVTQGAGLPVSTSADTGKAGGTAKSICRASRWSPEQISWALRRNFASQPAKQHMGLNQTPNRFETARLRTAIKFKCLVSLLGGEAAFCGWARAGTGHAVRREGNWHRYRVCPPRSVVLFSLADT